MGQHFLLAKIWRWHDNPMLTGLTPEDNLYLWEDQFASRALPFTDLPHPLSRFDRERQSHMDSLFETVKTPVKKIKSLSELKGLKLKAYYFYDDYYLSALDHRDVEFIFRHPQHFVAEEKALKAMTQKSNFTDFRLKLEGQNIYAQTSYSHVVSSEAEAHGIKCLNEFLKQAGPDRYLDERNEFEASKAGTHFSCLLSQGLLSPQHILSKLQAFEDQHGASKSSYWIKFELLWREFFYFIQNYSTRALYFSDAKSSLPLAPISLRGLMMDLAREPLIGAMLNELTQTGLLSNRCRQIFASYFVHLGRYDWRYGAYLFQYFLKDYDPSSNWGNWQYLAGVGRDPRGLRFFNLQTQLERYNPDGSYLAQWGNQKDFLAHL